jgi:nucleotide-binding universal stress UspA family protein|tara:strand:+ start:7484 stop:8302 length:819 start_codon:yes stop_codon:yes gene_type:complete
LQKNGAMINILLPTDFSENSWNAMVYGVNFFSQSEVHFHVSHILDETGTDVEFNNKKALTEVQAFLTRLRKIAHPKFHKFSFSIQQTSFISGIRKIIEDGKIHLVIMGTRGANLNQQSLVGKNSTAVISRIKCPILVVPEEATYKKPENIAFPTDFYVTYKTKILRGLKLISNCQQSKLKVLYYAKKPEALTDSQKSNRDFLKEQLSDIHHGFYYSINDSLEDALQLFIKSKEVQLIMMMGKNLNFFDQLLFYPVSEAPKYFKKIPFFVLHE